MNDPDVRLLRFKFVADDEYERAPRLAATLGPFEVELEKGLLRAKPTVHFAAADDAVDVLLPHLKGWEASAFLDRGERIRFEYVDADVVDRNPAPGIVHASAVARVGISASATATISHGVYPTPRPGFQVTPLTNVITERVRRWREGREPLLAAGYWVLTRLEAEYGSLPGAAKHMRVGMAVLSRLGELTALPDPKLGRKAKKVPRSINAKEQAWVEAAMRRLALRTGELALGTSSPVLTMKDLPAL